MSVNVGRAGRFPRLREQLQAFPRQALHAKRLAFKHPISSEELEFESALPEDMTELLNALRADLTAAASGGP